MPAEYEAAATGKPGAAPTTGGMVGRDELGAVRPGWEAAVNGSRRGEDQEGAGEDCSGTNLCDGATETPPTAKWRSGRGPANELRDAGR